ncbi:MAG: hypothetical protein IPL49_07555 [Saprospirales bacterium]|nr:hypothetical protein [Saprospirales bacterium]MBK8490740.1 hypothetical protein [Saprospirales bacterium]
MSQYTWTYVGGGGKNFRVTLFHGKNTGHVLLLLNTQVLQIDFNVRESKTYSFFIEDEFCEVHLELRGEEMYYFFEINKTVNTPRNKARKQLERKHLGQALAFFGVLILVATVAAFGLRTYNKKLEMTRLNEKIYSDSTVGWVQIDSLHPETVRYQYVAGNSPFTSSFFEDPARGNTLPVFPLQSGDEFAVRYNPRRPDLSRIYFSQPTAAQTLKYLERSLSRHLQYNPATHPSMARCTLELALEIHGLEGLADVYFQQESAASSPAHNRDSYYRLVRDPAFQQAISDRCWN